MSLLTVRPTVPTARVLSIFIRLESM